MSSRLQPVLTLCLFVLAASACTRKPLENRRDAMRLTEPVKIQDDLDLKTFVRGLSDQIAWLRKTGANKDLQFGPRKVSRIAYATALEGLRAQSEGLNSPNDLQDYLEKNFDFYEVFGKKNWGDIHLTSYFIPIIPGSRTKTDRFNEPFLKSPNDLLTISTSSYWNSIKEIGTMRGRVSPKNSRKIIPFYSRAEIYGGALKSRNLELVWVDPIDAFITQIQGSGTVQLKNGQMMRLGYADQNGHPYVAIGKFLFDVIPKEKMSLKSIEAHLRTLTPESLRILLAKNPSFVFFRKIDSEAITANTTPVQDGRTIASDARYFPKGALGMLTFAKPTQADPSNKELNRPVTRFVFDQDTGGAIKGGGRVDLFWGKGREAGVLAGSINQQAQMRYLVPKE